MVKKTPDLIITAPSKQPCVIYTIHVLLQTSYTLTPDHVYCPNTSFEFSHGRCRLQCVHRLAGAGRLLGSHYKCQAYIDKGTRFSELTWKMPLMWLGRPTRLLPALSAMMDAFTSKPFELHCQFYDDGLDLAPKSRSLIAWSPGKMVVKVELHYNHKITISQCIVTWENGT